MKAYLIDAYDSFVYIIYQYVRGLGIEADVVRNDRMTLAGIEEAKPDFILLGPGPGHPAEARYLEVIERFGGETPIFGVCLGHQAIGLAFQSRVVRATNLMHGKSSAITHDGKGCFSGIENGFRATRYHSLIVEEGSVGNELIVTANAQDDGYIMGLRHRTMPIESVQFHPESVNTQDGLRLIENFVRAHVTKPI